MHSREYLSFWQAILLRHQLSPVIAAVQINDGSTLSGLQVVVQPDVPGYNLLEDGTVNTGAAVRVQGELVESPGRGQKVRTYIMLYKPHSDCITSQCCEELFSVSVVLTLNPPLPP